MDFGLAKGFLPPTPPLGDRRNGVQLIILMYHGVIRRPLKVYDWCFILESSFRRQVKWLSRHFEVIPLSSGVERLRNGELRGPSAVITFDDGFQNNYDVAFPVLLQAEIPATIFPITGLVNTDRTIWSGYIHRALAETEKSFLDWEGCRLDISDPSARARTSSLIQKRLKRFPHPQLLREVRKLLAGLGDDLERPVESGSAFRMITREAISAMNSSGLIEFGAHTHTHAILSLLSPSERRNEIERAVAAVGKLTGHPCILFAYPNGLTENYDAATIETLQECGIQASVTAIEGWNDGMTPSMELRRYGIGADMNMPKFRRVMKGDLPGEMGKRYGLRARFGFR